MRVPTPLLLLPAIAAAVMPWPVAAQTPSDTLPAKTATARKAAKAHAAKAEASPAAPAAPAPPSLPPVADTTLTADRPTLVLTRISSNTQAIKDHHEVTQPPYLKSGVNIVRPGLDDSGQLNMAVKACVETPGLFSAIALCLDKAVRDHSAEAAATLAASNARDLAIVYVDVADNAVLACKGDAAGLSACVLLSDPGPKEPAGGFAPGAEERTAANAWRATVVNAFDQLKAARDNMEEFTAIYLDCEITDYDEHSLMNGTLFAKNRFSPVGMHDSYRLSSQKRSLKLWHSDDGRYEEICDDCQIEAWGDKVHLLKGDTYELLLNRINGEMTIDRHDHVAETDTTPSADHIWHWGSSCKPGGIMTATKAF